MKSQVMKLISQSLKPTWDLLGRSLHHQPLGLEINAEELHLISGIIQYLTGYFETRHYFDAASESYYETRAYLSIWTFHSGSQDLISTNLAVWSHVL